MRQVIDLLGMYQVMPDTRGMGRGGAEVVVVVVVTGEERRGEERRGVERREEERE